jgi:hypothetical protein
MATTVRQSGTSGGGISRCRRDGVPAPNERALDRDRGIGMVLDEKDVLAGAHGGNVDAFSYQYNRARAAAVSKFMREPDDSFCVHV